MGTAIDSCLVGRTFLSASSVFRLFVLRPHVRQGESPTVNPDAWRNSA